MPRSSAGALGIQDNPAGKEIPMRAETSIRAGAGPAGDPNGKP